MIATGKFSLFVVFYFLFFIWGLCVGMFVYLPFIVYRENKMIAQVPRMNDYKAILLES